MRSLRVLHVVSVPGVGGAQVYVAGVARALAGKGYRVAVACPDDPALVTAYAGVADVFPLPVARRLSPWRDLRFLVALVRLLRRERFDVVQTSAAKASLFGRLAARLAGVPVVIFTAHGFPFHPFMTAPLRWTLETLERVMSRACTDMVVSVSETDRRDAVARGIVPATRIRTIPNGIVPAPPSLDGAAARRRLGLALDQPVVGTVGRLARQKSPEDVVRVAAHVVREIPAAAFLLVGDGPLRAGLERLARDLGVARNVRFLGVRDDVDAILPALDVLLLTSLWEGMPLTILEAMAAGLPVVATRVNGVPEVVAHGATGLLAEPRDVPALAAHVLALLGARESAQAMGEAGRQRVGERFTFGRTVDALSDLYQELYAVNARGLDASVPRAGSPVSGLVR